MNRPAQNAIASLYDTSARSGWQNASKPHLRIIELCPAIPYPSAPLNTLSRIFFSGEAQCPPARKAKRSPFRSGKLTVPDQPIIPFIEGDGTGPDIWRGQSCASSMPPSQKAYGGKRKIAWMEVLAGREERFRQLNNWLPDETVEAFQNYLVGIKGPLTTPVGGGIRSLNVALRADARPLRLPAPGALLQGRALAGEAARRRWTW